MPEAEFFLMNFFNFYAAFLIYKYEICNNDVHKWWGLKKVFIYCNWLVGRLKSHGRIWHKLGHKVKRWTLERHSQKLSISLCQPPCCCFLVCFRHVKLTQTKVKTIRYLLLYLLYSGIEYLQRFYHYFYYLPIWYI